MKKKTKFNSKPIVIVKLNENNRKNALERALQLHERRWIWSGYSLLFVRSLLWSIHHYIIRVECSLLFKRLDKWRTNACTSKTNESIKWKKLIESLNLFMKLDEIHYTHRICLIIERTCKIEINASLMPYGMKVFLDLFHALNFSLYFLMTRNFISLSVLINSFNSITKFGFFVFRNFFFSFCLSCYVDV